MTQSPIETQTKHDKKNCLKESQDRKHQHQLNGEILFFRVFLYIFFLRSLYCYFLGKQFYFCDDFYRRILFSKFDFDQFGLEADMSEHTN